MFPRWRLAAGLLTTTAFLLSSCNSPTRPETARPEDTRTADGRDHGPVHGLRRVPKAIARADLVQLIANATAVNGSVADVSRRAGLESFRGYREFSLLC